MVVPSARRVWDMQNSYSLVYTKILVLIKYNLDRSQIILTHHQRKTSSGCWSHCESRHQTRTIPIHTEEYRCQQNQQEGVLLLTIAMAIAKTPRLVIVRTAFFQFWKYRPWFMQSQKIAGRPTVFSQCLSQRQNRIEKMFCLTAEPTSEQCTL